MAYGKIKADTLVYDNSGSDVEVTLASLGNKADLASPTFTGTPTVPGYAALAGATFTGNVVMSADLTVQGTTTTISSTTIEVADKNLELGKVSTPTDTTADGGGITLKGATDKTFNWVDANDAWTSSEHIHLGDNKKLLLGTGSDLEIYHDGSHSYIKDAGTGNLRLGAADLRIQTEDFAENYILGTKNDAVHIYFDNAVKLSTTAAGVTVTGTVTDSKGDVRSIPQQNEQGSAHTLVAADAGKHILADATVTAPPTSGIFSAGDAITIINTSGSDISIARGSGVTMHNSADGTNADRTLGTKGMATILCAGSDTYYISGAGLS